MQTEVLGGHPLLSVGHTGATDLEADFTGDSFEPAVSRKRREPLGCHGSLPKSTGVESGSVEHVDLSAFVLLPPSSIPHFLRCTEPGRKTKQRVK